MGLISAWDNIAEAHNRLYAISYDPVNEVAINCNPSSSTVSSDDQGTTYFRMDIVGFTISFLALSIVGFAILSDKRI